jgi:hypothetical protein
LNKKKTVVYRAKRLGPLPVEKINALLMLELEPGEAWLSQAAHRHIATDHADCYEICMEHIVRVVTAPTFVGQAPHHGGNIELIGRIPMGDGKSVLVAVGLTPNNFGNYNVRSSYVIDEKDLDNRKRSGRAKIVR